MHRPISKLVLPVLFALPAALDAATPYEDEVPIELARYFLPGNWYSDLPPDLPAFAIPDGMELVGSQDQTQRKRVLFRSTGLDAGEAQELLAQAILREAGWSRMDNSTDRISPSGFVAENFQAPLPAVQLCNDRLGMLTVAGSAEGFVNLGFFAPVFANNRPCAQRSQLQMLSLGSRSPYMDYVPLLELPDGISPIVPQRIVDATPIELFFHDTQAHITADTSLRRLANSFARQMRRQGWRRNEAWRGNVTAGNTWTRELQDDNRLAASIDIVRTAENAYSLKLQVMQMAQAE